MRELLKEVTGILDKAKAELDGKEPFVYTLASRHQMLNPEP